MRVYAFYCRNKWVLGIVMFEVIAFLSIGCVSATLENTGTCMFISVVVSHPNIAWRYRYPDIRIVSPTHLLPLPF